MSPGLFILLAVAVIVFILIQRGKKGSFTATDTMFSQAGVTVDMAKQTITIKGKTYSVDKVTHVRTETPPNKPLAAFDCVISIKDFNNPENRIRFINEAQANKFMQRLITAIEQAGGPVIR